jgi:hypothetical protein
MRAAAVMAVCLACSGVALAQTQNAKQTGTGGAFATLEALETAMTEQWSGLPGQIVKGAAGLAGMAAALAAANSAVTFKLRVRGDGSVDAAGATPVSSGTSLSTSTTSSSTSTN